jgi:hypothetical protein
LAKLVPRLKYISFNKQGEILKHILALLVFILLSGCAANPTGCSWALTDFNKYEKNYSPFPTKEISIGASTNS